MGLPTNFGPLVLAGVLSTGAAAQDVSPLRAHHVWLPMTGVTPEQMDDAVAAGYDTILLKLHPPVAPEGNRVDFSAHAAVIEQATSRGMKVICAILGWVGLGDGQFWDTRRNGERVPNRLDPFWPEAMQRVEWYFERVIDHYKENPHVVAFAPTWGIYGEAGFTSWDAGYSEHALARFNEWRAEYELAPLERLPVNDGGPNSEYCRFIRFRYLYLERVFDALIARLKRRAGGLPVGIWQEMYPVAGYLWTMVEVPSADFGLYESCFTYQTTHHPEKSLAETMGFRYRCRSSADYRDYYLPLLARKRGEGQRFMGCQLSNSYAANYGWSAEQAAEYGFDQWEDDFGPVLKRLLDEPLETPERDVLFVFPTYAAAALSDHPSHTADTKMLDTLLRMYGCQLARYGSPRLDKQSVADLDRFRLIVVPNAAFLMRETYERLKACKVTVLFTGCFGQALDGEYAGFDTERELDGLTLRYFRRPAGAVTVSATHPLTARLEAVLGRQPVQLIEDEAFGFAGDPPDTQVLLRCGEAPLLSVRGNGRLIFLHGQAFATLSYNPDRKPQALAGSADASANEHDPWWLYDSANPQNELGRLLLRNLLEHAGVQVRVTDPPPPAVAPYLGDHLESVSISANLVYNNTDRAQTVAVRTPFRPAGYITQDLGGLFETRVRVPAYSYIALQPRKR